MKQELTDKIRRYFGQMSIYKDKKITNSLFAGRNLPDFVKDFLIKRYLNIETGEIDKSGLTMFLDKVIPIQQGAVKDHLQSGEEVMLLTRFSVIIDLIHNERRFAIPDYRIKDKETYIPDYIYNQHKGDFVEGEKWGVIKLCLLEDDNGKTSHIHMVDYKPFKPYSVDTTFWAEARQNFTTTEWIDFILSAMGYEAEGFTSLTMKLEFLTRLLTFVEPRLNVIELAPKGTAKSYVFGNLSKYGWLMSGGKVTRAKLFFDKARQQNGIMKNHDYTAFDEIQTIVFQEPAEMHSILKAYLEQGKTTIDNYEFTSECGLMLMGNIGLTKDHFPRDRFYFKELPEIFRESALLDRFHCFIEGWLLPRVTESMILQGWTVNVEYFSEILHVLRTKSEYNSLVDQLLVYDKNASLRDITAVKRVTTAYVKLLFPHWRKVEDVNIDEFRNYCFEPAVHRRGIIMEQCHLVDPEFKPTMPYFDVKEDLT